MLIRWYLFKGKKVYFFRLNKLCGNKSWVNNYIDRGNIKRLKFDQSLDTFDGVYYDSAFDNINIFSRILRKNKSIEKVERLYDDKHIKLAFKKVLNEKLARFYYLNYILSKIQDKYPNRKITFIPSNGIEIYRTDGCEIYDYFKFYKWAEILGAGRLDTSKIKFPIWATAGSYINVFRRKASTFIKIFGFLFWVTINKIINISKRAILNNNYKYAFMIISPPRQFSNSIQKVDFLIDNILIKRDESLFISYKPLNKRFKKYLKDGRLDYLDDVDKVIHWKNILSILPVYFKLLFSFREEDFILDVSLKLIYCYLRWASFINKTKIDKLVTYADFSLQSIARNIILEKHGCKSYYYMDCAGFGYVSSKNDSNVKHRHNCYGFLYYDFFISWCDKASRYFEECHCRFKNYINLGCFWSEHIRLIQKGEIKSNFKNKLYFQGYKEGMKLVTAFDSSFHDSSLTTYTDGIKFLEGILKLLEDLPNLFIVLKEKKPRKSHQKFTSKFKEILEIYTKLENHKRCYCVKNRENASEIIAFSGLTVSFPFTSTTFEALSTRKKAIWYDVSGKFRDSFYDSIPGLVCHSYEELLKRVKNLLLETSEEEYANYIDKYVKGKIESYLDGKAITRFRALLTDKYKVNAPKTDSLEFAGEKN